MRDALGGFAIARPAIDLRNSFTKFAVAGGLIVAGQSVDIFTNDATFLLGAFIFKDIAVTAYNGALTSLASKGNLAGAASLMATEAYHAGAIRYLLFQIGIGNAADAIANLRAALSRQVSGFGNDAGVLVAPPVEINVAPANARSLAFARSADEVLNILYGGGSASGYLFFPNRFNGIVS